MSIASEITRLQGVKSDILQAIAGKGVTVPAGSMLDDCPALIASIPGPTYGDGVIIGDKHYDTVIIGSQEWITYALDYTPSGVTVGTNAYYYNDDESTYGWNGYKCGLLYDYNAVAVIVADTSLPSGWRVPSESDLLALISSLNGGGASALKAKDKSVTSSFPVNWYGNNTTGLSVLTNGGRRPDASYYGNTDRTGLWVSSARKYLPISDTGQELIINSESDNAWCNSIYLVRDT